MKNITVLHCSEVLSVSGCCRVMEHLASGLDKERFTSYFCAGLADPDYLAYLQARGIISMHAGKTLPEIPRPFVAILHRSGNSTPFWDRLILQLREAGVSAIIERNIFGYRDMHMDRQLDYIFANSLNTLWHHWRRSGRPAIGHYLRRHRVLYNAVGFAPPLEELETLRAQWRQQLQIAPEDFVLGIITRPDALKIDALIVGLVPLLKKTIPNFTLVTRAYPEAPARLLKQMLGSRYHNLPLSSDMEILKATYALMDVCGNFPSIGESFGMAIAEAMRAYKPVVALDLPGRNKGNSQRELIDNGVTGFLCSTPTEIATALQILKEDVGLRMQMGLAGRQKMTAPPFSLESVMAQFEGEILHHVGKAAIPPMLPDVASIRNYLETYPQRLTSGKIKPVRGLLLPVMAVQFLWRMIRKFL